MVHLPIWGELRAGKYRLNSRETTLLESLERITQTEVVSLLSYCRWTNSLDDYFLLPYDNHPNKAGARMYAEAIERSLRQ